MINRVVLVGRLTKDIELRKTASNLSVAQFTLACDKRIKPKTAGAPTADFIPCVAWRQSAEFLAQYARKGQIVGVEGSISTRNYQDNTGATRYVTEVTCDNVRLIGSAPRSESPAVAQDYNRTYTPAAESHFGNADDDFANTPSYDVSSDDLPFY